MKKKKNAFTLIELLAIIVILAIIAVITVPIILNIIENSRKGAAKDSAFGYKDSIYKYYLERLSKQSDYSMPDGTYTIDSSTGYLISTTNDILEFQISGQIPSGTVELYKNVIKQACIKFGDYAVNITNGNVGDVRKASCDVTLAGDSGESNTPNVIPASQTIIASAITESELSDYTKSTLKVSVAISHSAITENAANGSTISELTSYRYMGADPDNYIYFNCNSYDLEAQNKTNCEVWRIISVENGHLKITTDSAIVTGPWDEGEVNHNYAFINDWSTSDLKDFLNRKYLNNSVNVSYINNLKTIMVDYPMYMSSFYDSFTAATSEPNKKAYGIINSATVDLIADSAWYLGGGSTAEINAVQAYAMERGNVSYFGDNIYKPTYVESRVAIISPSDYAFASSECYGNSSKKISDYDDCVSSNWMFTGESTWLLSPYSDYSDYAWSIDVDGCVNSQYEIDIYGGVRPSLYLSDEIGISGLGTSNDPYKIIVNQ